jgi:hypothetical protein
LDPSLMASVILIELPLPTILLDFVSFRSTSDKFFKTFSRDMVDLFKEE